VATWVPLTHSSTFSGHAVTHTLAPVLPIWTRRGLCVADPNRRSARGPTNQTVSPNAHLGSEPRLPTNAGCARHCHRADVNDGDLRWLVAASRLERATTASGPLAAYLPAMSSATPPHPPRRCWRSSMPSLRTSSLRTATTPSDTRRRSAGALDVAAPGCARAKPRTRGRASAAHPHQAAARAARRDCQALRSPRLVVLPPTSC
jgi:hypothetical protein